MRLLIPRLLRTVTEELLVRFFLFQEDLNLVMKTR